MSSASDERKDFLNSRKKASVKVAARHFANVIGGREGISSLKQLFQTLDVDSSGSLSHEEFLSGVQEFGLDVSDSQIRDLISLLDVNQDGEIDLEEFEAIAKSELELAEIAETWDTEGGATAAVEDAAVKATHEGTRFVRTPSVSSNEKKQGNPEMMTAMMMAARESLKVDPRIHSLIRDWWDQAHALRREMVPPGQTVNCQSLNNREYVTLSIALHRMLQPGIAKVCIIVLLLC